MDFNWFYIYPNLKTFYFEGTEEEYKVVKKDTKANKQGLGLTNNSQEGIDEWAANLTVYFYSETEPTEEGNYWHYVNGVPVAW